MKSARFPGRIWKAYDGYSKLNVFASGGGGQTWGGKSWSAADEGYRKLMEKYHLIDLYDGHHKSYGFHAKTANLEIFEMIRKAIEDSADLHSISTRSKRIG